MSGYPYNPPKWLLVDDIRHYPVDDIARDYWSGVKALMAKAYDGLLIDYQLSDKDPAVPTGLDVLEQAHRRGVLPRHIHVVSTHPTGKKAIDTFLAETGYVFHKSQLDIGHAILPTYWEKPVTRQKRRVVVHMTETE